MRTFHILGVMSGSSLDALDLAMVRFALENNALSSWELMASATAPLTETWRTRLAEVPGSLSAFFQLHVDFGRLVGSACAEFIAQQQITPDAIASHGHTLLHKPEAGYTIQVGHPAYITQATGIPVISDLRSNDIAAGGQGAPLAPVVEKYCFPGFDYYANLGGIANLSCFRSDGRITAWDIGPCNQLLNYVAGQTGKQFDENGTLARSGMVDPGLFEKLRRPFPLPLSEPRSLDNGWVRDQYIPILNAAGLSPADQLATLTEFIAESMHTQVLSLSKDASNGRLLVTGGGAHNIFLIDRIRQAVTPVEVVVPDPVIIDFKEAILMALCGLLRLLGKPNAFASVTGATHDTVNGILTFADPQSR